MLGRGYVVEMLWIAAGGPGSWGWVMEGYVHTAHMLACELGSTHAELARTECSRGSRVVTGRLRIIE